jgi:hypothetical protein
MYVEEILDAFQREAMDDESLQPIVRQVSRIHVIEESRHIGYAREETIRALRHTGRIGRWYDQLMLGIVMYLATTALINPRVYAECGLDAREARRAAAGNPHWQETKCFAAAKVLAFFDAAGLIGRGNRWLLRRAGVLTGVRDQ